MSSVFISGHEVLFLSFNDLFEVVEWSKIPYVEDKVLFSSKSAKEVAEWCFNNPK